MARFPGPQGPLAALALIVSMVLAGCTSGAGPADDTTAPPQDPLLGAIEGAVLDDQALPLEGAQVGLRDSEASGRTGGDGRFLLSNIEPGSYDLLVSKVGYTSIAKRVAVEAGKTTAVPIELKPVAVAAPRYETNSTAGRFECSVALVDVLWLECPGSNTVWPTSSSRSLFSKPLGVRHIVAELRWQATSAATGNNLDFNIVNRNGSDCQWYANEFGPSPLKIQVTIGQQFVNPHSPAATGCDDKIIDDADTQLAFDLYSSPVYATDVATVGATLQQPFEIYYTFFFDMDVPEGFTALPDT
jgi:hypothetical protein